MKKFVKSSLVDQIFDYIQGEIIHGTWKPGEKLPSETELAASLEVSRHVPAQRHSALLCHGPH